MLSVEYGHYLIEGWEEKSPDKQVGDQVSFQAGELDGGIEVPGRREMGGYETGGYAAGSYNREDDNWWRTWSGKPWKTSRDLPLLRPKRGARRAT
eukprot:6492060-Heterocapsa_arctica.AAC.1